MAHTIKVGEKEYEIEELDASYADIALDLSFENTRKEGIKTLVSEVCKKSKLNLKDFSLSEYGELTLEILRVHKLTGEELPKQ